MKLFNIILIISFLCSFSVQYETSVLDKKDYLVMVTKYKKSWIDSEVKTFLITPEHEILPVNHNGLEDDYIYCLDNKKLYPSNLKLTNEEILDLDFYAINMFEIVDSENEFTTKNDSITYKFYKVDFQGLICNAKDDNTMLFPIKYQSYPIKYKEKRYIKSQLISRLESKEL